MKLIKQITLLLLIIASTISYAQEGKDHEKIKALKIAHLTNELSLTPVEAQKFWPIYNAHETAIEAIKKTEKEVELRKKIKNNSDLNESEAALILKKMRTLNEKRVKERTNFISTIEKQFSAKKALQLMAAEVNFKRRMLNRYKSRFDERKEDRKKALNERRDKLEDARSEKYEAYQERRDKLMNERANKNK